MRWEGQCYRCGELREIESRPTHAMQALCDECAAKPHVRPKAPPESAKRSQIVIATSTGIGVRFKPIHWLWNQYVALSKIALVAGLPGQGKSQLTCLLAAWTSRGELDAPAGDVVIVSGEDDPADTIWPRLGASGADLSRVHLLDVRRREPDGTIWPTLLALPDHARGLTDVLAGLPSPRLLVLDPVQAFIGTGVDTYRSGDVRRALAPLVAIAERFAMAVLLVTHLNKSKDAEPLARITDSGAFVALARGVMLMAPDPEDEDGDRGAGKVLAIAKANNASTGEHSLRFGIAPVTATDGYGTTVGVSRLELLGRSKLSAYDLLTPAAERGPIGEAQDFLRAELADRWRPSVEISKVAKALGIAEATLKRAKHLECARARRVVDDAGKASWWCGLKTVPWQGNGQGATRARGHNFDPLDLQADSKGPGDQEDQDHGYARATLFENGTDHLRRRDAMLGEPWGDDE